VRCNYPATELHHLNEPHTVQQFYDSRNVVGLCAHDHPGGRRGTPEWIQGIDYAQTVFTVNAFSYSVEN